MLCITAVVVGAPRRLLRRPGAKNKFICRIRKTEGPQGRRDRHERIGKAPHLKRKPNATTTNATCYECVSKQKVACVHNPKKRATDGLKKIGLRKSTVGKRRCGDNRRRWSNLDGKISIDSTLFSRFYLIDNHKTAQCQHTRNLASIIRTCNCNFQHWRTSIN